MNVKLLFLSIIGLQCASFGAHQKFVVNSLNKREIVIVPDSTLLNVKQNIQEAVDSLKKYGGGTVYLSAGVYKIENVQNAISVVNAKNIVFRGDGAATEFRAMNTSGDGADAIFYLNNSTNIKFVNIYFKGLVLPQSAWGNNSSYHGALQINGSSYIDVTGCHFTGFYTGGIIMQSVTTNSNILNCTFDGVDYKLSGDYGAVMLGSNSKHITISQNHFKNVRFSAISGYSSTEVIITENEAQFDPLSSYSMGIYFPHGIQNSIISNNRFLNPANEGIVISEIDQGASGIAINYNTISGNVILAKYAGININLLTGVCAEVPANFNTISNNIIYGSSIDKVDHGVFLSNTHFTNVSNNIVVNAAIAIDLNNCPSHTSVTGNQIDESDNGIRFFGSGTVIGNIINNTASGISYGYISNATIQHNVFTNVLTPLTAGANSASARLGDNM
jgi:parallel beta helix pectate lyase-like protein